MNLWCVATLEENHGRGCERDRRRLQINWIPSQLNCSFSEDKKSSWITCGLFGVASCYSCCLVFESYVTRNYLRNNYKQTDTANYYVATAVLFVGDVTWRRHSSASDPSHNACSDMHSTRKSSRYAKCIPVPSTFCLLDCVQQQNPFSLSVINSKASRWYTSELSRDMYRTVSSEATSIQAHSLSHLMLNKAKCVIEIFRGIEPWKVRERDTHSCSF